MNYIEKIFKKSGLISILESLIIALLGIILIIEPEGTLKFITCSLGVIFILANKGIDVIDCGVPVLSMHSPYEVTSKIDLYEAYRAYKAFWLN